MPCVSPSLMPAPTVVAVWRTVERGIGGSAASVQAKGRGSTQWKRPWQLAGSDAPFSFANRRPRQGQDGKGGGGRGRHRRRPVEAGSNPSGPPPVRGDPALAPPGVAAA